MKRSPFNSTSHAALDEPLDPAIQAELDQLDAALRGEPIEDDVLAALVREVQATTPEMPAGLRKQLRHDVAEGFGRGGVRRKLGLGGKRREAGPAGGKRRTGSLIYGGGLAATVLVMVGIGFALSMSESTTSYDASEVTTMSDSAAPPEESAAAGGASSESTLLSRDRFSEGSATSAAPGSTDSARSAPKPEPSANATPATGQRRVEQSVDLTVAVKSGKLPEATGKVEDIVRLGRGYVANSEVSTGTAGAGTATYTLKVASSELDRTLKRLGDLGTVTSQQQQSRDITSSFDSAQQRLDDNKQVRAALLRSLAKAETDGQIASLNRRLADNRRSRESLEAQLAKLRSRTNLTTVALSLRAPAGDEPAADDDGSWSLGDAASDALGALSAVTGVLLVGAAVLLPFALIALAAWAVYRVRRKRSRESALD